MEFAFCIQLDLPNAARDRKAIEELLPQLALTALQVRHAKRENVRRQLVELLVGDVQPTDVDMQSARLEAQAYRQIFTGSKWLTAQEIGELANLGTGNPVATVNRWKKERKIFAVHRDGRDYFPRYGLGPDFRPRPQLAQVLKVLAGYDGERLAAWFESTSSFLGGKRPREVVATAPKSVVDAAQDAVEAEQLAG